jgi:hypothetical protein
LINQIDYFEIFLETDGVVLKIGETTNNNYFIKNETIRNGSRILIKSVNKYNASASQTQAFNIRC